MKKTTALAAALFAAFSLMAGPGGPRPGNGGPGGRVPSSPGRGSTPMQVQPRPSPAPRHSAPPHPKHDAWGKGGRNFWPGFVGGIIGAAVAPTPSPPATTVIVTQPAPPPPPPGHVRVWVSGRYVDEVQPNGIVVRRWVPGHYEWR